MYNFCFCFEDFFIPFVIHGEDRSLFLTIFSSNGKCFSYNFEKVPEKYSNKELVLFVSAKFHSISLSSSLVSQTDIQDCHRLHNRV